MRSRLTRRTAVDKPQDAVSGRVESGVEPERPGQRVRGLEVDRDLLVATVMCPGERGVDECVPDASTTRVGQGGGRADVGLAVWAQARYW
jgi:hypothetical protein